MKLKLLLLCLLTLLLGSINAQPLIQGTIKKGSTDSQVEIWLKPNFSNSTQYLAQIGLPIAIPASAAPQPTGITVTQDPSFTAAFGINYTVTVNAPAFNTGATEKYFNIVLIRSGGGASNPQNWTEGVEFKLLTVTFNYSGAAATFLTKLADYQDGGSDGQGYFYTADGNANYYITTNSIQNFYASPNNSIVGGTAGAGYAQIMAAVNAGTVSGTSPLCIGASATYATNGDAGGTWTSSNTSVATVNATTGQVNAVAAGTTDITYTISGVSAFKTLTVDPNVFAGTVTGSSPLCIGATTNYSSNGTEGGVWSSSNPAVATVDAISGLVTAVGAGTSNITYTVNSGCGSPVSAFATLTVNPNVSAGTVSGTSPLTVGQTDTYTSNGTAGGTWSSSNPSVATVNSTTGQVSAIAAGNTNITYTVNSGCGSPVSSFKALTVNAPTNAGTVSGTSPLCIGATATYSTNGDAGGSWSSSNTSVATVNASTGLVTAVGAGTTDITYTVNSVSAFKTLTVSPNVSAGTITGSVPLCIGDVTGFSSNGTAGGTWSSANTGVATVDPITGNVTAVGAGTTNITYTVNSGCGSPVSAFAAVTVNPNVTAGTVSGTSPLNIGQTDTYTSNGTAGGTWSSSNISVATVNSTTGLVTAIAAGNTNITYTVNSGCGSPVSSLKALTVNAPSNAGNVSGTSPLCIGATATYTSNGDAGGTWSSTNTSVATINATTGLVTAISAGTTDITYTINGASAFKTLTVNSNVNAGTVAGTSPLCIGGGATFTSNGTAGGTWSSSNTAVATVNASTGAVTAVGSGSTNITYTVNTGCGSPVSAFAALTVNPNVSAGTVSGTSPLNIGQTDTYTSNGTSGGTWSSSNPSIATVNSTTGLVTAVAAGGTNITYTVNSGCGSPVSSVKALIVNAPTNAGTVSGTSPLCIGATDTYTSNGDAGGTWSSTNTSVATVNASTGLVTAVGAGTTDITYTINGASAFKTLTVNPNVSAGTVSGTSPLCIGGGATFISNGTAGGTWSSSNTAVATVNASTGAVTAVGSGSTNITYTVNTGCGSPVSAFAPLTVNPSVSAGTVSGTSPLCIDGTATYTSNGAAGGTWSSSNTSVATVNATTGLVTAVNTGSANITYTVNTGCGSPVSAFKTLTVNALPVVAAITGSTSITAGSTSQLSSATAGGTWSSNNTGVATVNASTGLVTAVAEGSATINYAVTNGCGTTTVSTTVTVSPLVLSLIQGTIKPGASSNEVEVWLKPDFSNSTQYLAQIGLPIAWPTSATQPTNVSVTLDPGFIASFGNNYSISVYPVAHNTANTENYVTIVLLREGAGASEAQTWTAGSEFKVLTATFNPSSSTNSKVKLADYQDGGSDGQGNFYTASGNANYYITSNSIGNFYAAPGLSTVGGNATAGFAETINTVGCVNPTVDPITGTTTVCAGATTQLSNITAGGTWSSNNTGVATVNPTTGLVSGVAAGTATITYLVTNSCGSSSVSALVTVNGKPTVASITGSTTICVGATTQLANATAGGTWSSSNTSAATIDQTGLVTGVGGGTTTISYEVSNSCGTTTVTALVTVNAAPVVAPITGTTTITVGGTSTLASATAGGTWSSDNTSVATVNASTGKVNAIAPGTANISYSLTNACGTTTVSATVTVDAAIVQLIQGTIKPGAASNDIEVWLKPTFNNNTEYLAQIGMPIAWSASSPDQPTSLNVTLDPAFVAAFGDSYTVTVNPVANNTGNTEKYFNIVLIRGGEGASDPQTWIAGTEYKVLTASFVPATTPNGPVKLADYQDGGSDGQGNFYTASGNANYYITSNSIENFYASPGNSIVGGNAAAGYAQTLTNIGGCIAPVIVATNINANATGNNCSASVSFGSNVTVTGGGTVVYKIGATVITSPSTFNTGTTTVTVTASNSCGSTTSSFTVTVTDATNPVVNCPANISRTTNTCNKSISTSNPTFSDNCSVTKLTWVMTGATTSNSASTGFNYVGTKTFNTGVTTVTYTAWDAAGNAGTCSFTVTVVDGIKPFVKCPSNLFVTAGSDCNKLINTVKPTVGDNCGVAKLIWVMTGATTGASPTSGINYVGTQNFNVGTTTVTYTASDAYGNTATCSYTIKVVDKTRPVLNCPGNITQTAAAGNCSKSVAVPNPIVSDNCGIKTLSWVMFGATNAISPLTGINYIGTRNFNAGLTFVTYVAQDESGNISICAFTVRINASKNCYYTTNNWKPHHPSLFPGTRIDVKAYPNPSTRFFDLRIETESNEEVFIKIMDISGRQLQQFRGTPDKVYRFGDGLTGGTYIVEVIQGNKRTTTKVIKAN